MNEKVGYIETNEISIAFENFEHKLTMLDFINQILTNAHESFFQNHKNHMIKDLEDLVKSKSNELTEAEKIDISKIIRFNQKIQSRVNEFTKIDVETEKGSEKLYEFSNFSNIAKHTPDFFREMSLVYLVSSFEKYLQDILNVIINNNLELLNKDKQMKVEEIIQFNDIKVLKERLIERELYDLFYKGIDDISDYLKRKFSIELQSDFQWKDFRERFYKRNLLIHNDGYPNDIYLKNIDTTDMSKIQIDNKYLEDSFKIFYKYSQVIKVKLYDKKYDLKIDAKSIE